MKRFASSIRMGLQLTPTQSIQERFPSLRACAPEIKIERILASVMLARLTEREAEIAVIPATSSGCSAMIGRAPKASTTLAQSLIAIGLVMQ